jgi:epidermal growth factor receptor substrate 15
MFAGLDNDSQTNGNELSKGLGTSLETPSKPPIQRTETENDDPILRRLTSMGYPRDKSLAALEKFDYNLDKASNQIPEINGRI